MTEDVHYRSDQMEIIEEIADVVHDVQFGGQTFRVAKAVDETVLFRQQLQVLLRRHVITICFGLKHNQNQIISITTYSFHNY